MSAAEGGVLCPNCGHDRVGTVPLSLSGLKVLRFLQTRDWETCRLLRLSPASNAEVERIIYDYITYYLERRLKSVDFLNRLRRQMAIEPGS
jgi:DNA repair protein RecO (recombination protein O)